MEKYFIYIIKCDQIVDYGTIKSSIVRISPLHKISGTDVIKFQKQMYIILTWIDFWWDIVSNVMKGPLKCLFHLHNLQRYEFQFCLDYFWSHHKLVLWHDQGHLDKHHLIGFFHLQDVKFFKPRFFKFYNH